MKKIMSNPFGEPNDESAEILEGFLCPICREDLKSFDVLTEHFARAHAEEEDVLKSVFKDIFVKAKKKIRNFDESFDLSRSLKKNATISGSSGSGGGVGGVSNWNGGSANNNNSKTASNSRSHLNVYNFLEHQEIGAERGHFEYFQTIRDPRLERYAAETNKLIIRLNKLLKDMPSDPVLRKQHEQNTVTWLDGSSVKLCPSCAKSFHIARRQHHCRLCGSIMCNDCSKFLPIDIALELTSLTVSNNEIIKQLQTTATANPHRNGVRSCYHCLWLLETRQEMQESRSCNPPVSQLYSLIHKTHKAVIPDIDMYTKMIGSLYEGESIFTIADASALRGKIGQIAEVIDLHSKRILSLPCQQGSREEALHKAIRLSCIQIIKEKMLSLPTPPAEEEVRKIQEKKRLEAELRIENERLQAIEAYERYGLDYEEKIEWTTRDRNYAQGTDLRTLDNWTAHQISANDIVQNDDPLVEQINIIKGYIKQARRDMNFDVVETLELNLRELQREYYERQNALHNTIKNNVTANATIADNTEELH